jgi:undecaprenyl-phosphate galactose phosphotransferase
MHDSVLSENINKKIYCIFKRILDVILSILILIVCFPLLLLIAILIKLDGTGGKILVFKLERVGYKGESFDMYKFRTMVPNARHLIKTEDYKHLRKKQTSGSFKIKNSQDPRITWIGTILRSLDLDELPQFINVLRGEMSIVGPRPYDTEEIRLLIKQNAGNSNKFAQINQVKPGITGLWQVSGRNNLTILERIDLDVQYVRNLSFMQDIRIIIKTPWVVLTRKGAW